MIRVNGIQIPEQKLFAEVQYHPASSRDEALDKATRALIIAELLRQRVAELGLLDAVDDADAIEDVDAIEDAIERLLAQEVVTPAASESECARYYEANQQRFVSSLLLELRHILVAAEQNAADRVAAKDRAEALLARLQAGEDFSALAQTESVCPSKTLGGNLGQISRGQMVPEFERQVFGCDAGLLPRPIETRYGFHLVLIERKESGRQLPYAAVSATIAKYLNEKVRRKATAQYLHTLIANAGIEGYNFDIPSAELLQ